MTDRASEEYSIDEEFLNRALKGDGQYAVAYALMQLTDAVQDCARSLEEGLDVDIAGTLTGMTDAINGLSISVGLSGSGS